MTTDIRHTNDELTDENTPDTPEGWESFADGSYLKEYYSSEQEVAVAIQEYKGDGAWHVTTHRPNEARGGLMDLHDSWQFDTAGEACEKAAELLKTIPN